MTTQTGAIAISTAVATTLRIRAERAISDERNRGAGPCLRPRRPAADGPNPIVEKPPGVRNESGVSTGYC